MSNERVIKKMEEKWGRESELTKLLAIRFFLVSCHHPLRSIINPLVQCRIENNLFETVNRWRIITMNLCVIGLSPLLAGECHNHRMLLRCGSPNSYVVGSSAQHKKSHTHTRTQSHTKMIYVNILSCIHKISFIIRTSNQRASQLRTCRALGSMELSTCWWHTEDKHRFTFDNAYKPSTLMPQHRQRQRKQEQQHLSTAIHGQNVSESKHSIGVVQFLLRV